MSATPFPSLTREWQERLLTFHAGMPYLEPTATSHAPQTRLVRNNATAIPPCKFCNLLKQRRIFGVFTRFSLNFCSWKTGHIQLLGGRRRNISKPGF
jgi:hypothetical protein